MEPDISKIFIDRWPSQALACVRLTTPQQEARYPDDAEQHFEEVPKRIMARHGKNLIFFQLEWQFLGVSSHFETKPIWQLVGHACLDGRNWLFGTDPGQIYHNVTTFVPMDFPAHSWAGYKGPWIESLNGRWGKEGLGLSPHGMGQNGIV